MKKGLVIKMIAGQYSVKDLETSESFDAIARGKLRHIKVDADSTFNQNKTMKTKKEIKTLTISPKVGDLVFFDHEDGQTIIYEVLPRKNDLVRPDVANVDQVLLLFSAVEPEFSFTLLDKFLIILLKEQLHPQIVVTKIDKVSPEALKALKEKLVYYQTIGFELYYINSKQRIGFDTMTHIFKDKITVLAGQTGVGKSTLLNALMPELNLKTQAISKALGRGKHTTRHSELYVFNEGYIADTPGFSKIEFYGLKAEDIKAYYPDYERLSSACKFGHSCVHINEPGCAVRLEEKNEVMQMRYDQYVSFYQEIKNQKKKY